MQPPKSPPPLPAVPSAGELAYGCHTTVSVLFSARDSRGRIDGCRGTVTEQTQAYAKQIHSIKLSMTTDKAVDESREIKKSKETSTTIT